MRASRRRTPRNAADAADARGIQPQPSAAVQRSVYSGTAARPLLGFPYVGSRLSNATLVTTDMPPAQPDRSAPESGAGKRRRWRQRAITLHAPSSQRSDGPRGAAAAAAAAELRVVGRSKPFSVGELSVSSGRWV
eukprot:353472-Chlamydomonas_euryale.AAC.5